eukprot:TRINITY_DN28489_c0_g2_i1.p1 TRINITY_DN28489_c0_g2~~TRINITY_DN28489_c0_g2_i1.p1  ORF type:complete len:362 (-),score=80.56 TRINITY_DN28489_c0_g2_i1:127-1050(-)
MVKNLVAAEETASQKLKDEAEAAAAKEAAAKEAAANEAAAKEAAAKEAAKKEEAEKKEVERTSLPWMDMEAVRIQANFDKKSVPTGPRRPSSLGLSLEQYAASHESDFNELLAMEPLDGWNFKAEQDGAKIYTKPDPDRPNNMFKSVYTITVSEGKWEILAGLLDVESRKEWDEMVIQAKTVEAHFPFYRLSYVAIKSPAFVISDRDLLLLGRIRFDQDGSVLISLKSTTHPDYPEKSGLVRAEMVCGGYIIRPTASPQQFNMIWCGCVNPSGWLPTAVANAVAWKQGLTLPRVAQHIAKKSKARKS